MIWSVNKEKMVERGVAVSLGTRAVLGPIAAEVDPQVKVPATLLAVSGDLVDCSGTRRCAFLWESALGILQLQVVTTVARRDGGLGSGAGVVVWRRGGE